MTDVNWKRFKFFDIEQVRNDSIRVITTKDIMCATSGGGCLFFGDAEGGVSVVRRGFSVQHFQAFNQRCNHLYQTKKGRVLVAIGDAMEHRTFDEQQESQYAAKVNREHGKRGMSRDRGGMAEEEGSNTEFNMPPCAVVKFFKIDKRDDSGQMQCVREFKIFGEEMSETGITCFAVMEDLSMLACGLQSGQVLLFKGNLLRKTRLVGSASPVPQIIDCGAPLTHLSFCQKHELANSHEKRVSLFIVTSKKVESRIVLGRGVPIIELDGHAGGRHVIQTSQQQLVVGRREAVHFYSAEDPLSCYVFQGEKSCLGWFRNSLVVAANNARGNHEINVYDLKNKFVALNLQLGQAFKKNQTVRYILCEWGSIFLMTSANEVWELKEKDVETKLQELFKKNLYGLAITLANTSEYDSANLSDIYRMYGDHLYAKGDYDSAAKQYIVTIGVVEPSYVIRQFLTAQQIQNLTLYLEELHKSSANADHTTLLLNCYTKLKEEKKLRQFIRGEDRDGSDISETDSGQIVPKFDVVTAMTTLRSAGYIEEALYLAVKHAKHDWYFILQLEDLQRYEEAIEYTFSLPFEDARYAAQTYGKVLLDQYPERFTELVKALCTDYTPVQPVKAPQLQAQSNSANRWCNPQDFIHCFVGHPLRLREFLEYVVRERTVESQVVWNTIIELHLREYHQDTQSTEWAQLSKEERQAQRDERESRVMDVLRNPEANYDRNSALCMVQMMNCGQGQLYLYEKMRMFHLVVQHFMDRGDDRGVIQRAIKYGTKDPNLWVNVLTYFASQDKVAEEELQEVLRHIEEEALLQPMLIIQILAKNPKLPISVIRPYLTRRLEADSKAIKQHQEQIKKSEKETTDMLKQIEQLQTAPKIFSNRKCASSGLDLELPSVHFMNGNSYNLDSLGLDQMCPKLREKKEQAETILENLSKKSSQHEKFIQELEGSGDGFATVATYFGNGLFEPSVTRTRGGGRKK